MRPVLFVMRVDVNTRFRGCKLPWRGSLLPLGRAAALNQVAGIFLEDCGRLVGAAAQPGGSKLPRHRLWGELCGV
jgi:hypothetical protein